MKTYGALTTEIAVWFTMLSPVIGLIAAFLGALVFGQLGG
jgi:hypothetical protein